MEATSEKKFSEISSRFFTQAGITPNSQNKFIYNSKELYPDSNETLKELGINNGAIIYVIGRANKYYLLFYLYSNDIGLYFF